MEYKLKSYVQLSTSILKKGRLPLPFFWLPPWWIEGRLGGELVCSWHWGEVGKAVSRTAIVREEPRSRFHAVTTPRHKNTSLISKITYFQVSSLMDLMYLLTNPVTTCQEVKSPFRSQINLLLTTRTSLTSFRTLRLHPHKLWLIHTSRLVCLMFALSTIRSFVQVTWNSST